ncbi:GxxExxY protein [Plectonema cf. radiosum LEGE 06105]|uniref:GxxExxY protein n=1 Tax=Plectonema cf. radiosum LEGE 06105 TaxID=945769 RepID=A0A8J7K2K8_9CYAN|nr:GxxExxY protein [Plectonema radiosum]MBE9214342.1 GxxExxY protein [Plectonema cf. radiosum LEGE 06105]
MREFGGLEQLTYGVIGAAIEVHRILGAGFLESVYQEALAVEFSQRKIPYRDQFPIAVSYKGHPVGEGRLDFLVSDILVVELKAVENLTSKHEAQVISYLKTTQKPLGLLINFNVPILKQGIKRLILSS